jgi:hypothetical protein
MPQCVELCKYWFLTGKTKHLETKQTSGHRLPEKITRSGVVVFFALGSRLGTKCSRAIPVPTSLTNGVEGRVWLNRDTLGGCGRLQ